MHKSLDELREIASRIGLQILESEEEPASFYLVRQITADSALVARVDMEVPERTHLSLSALANALALAIEEFVAMLMTNIQQHCRVLLDTQEINPESVQTRSGETGSGEPLSDQDLISLAQTLHELAKDLVEFRRKSSEGSEGS